MSELYAELRSRVADADTLAWFRAEKDALFRTHPQSPIPSAERARFTGLKYWPYDPEARALARFTEAVDTPAPHRGEIEFVKIGALSFELKGAQLQLSALWIEGYAGGLFVPFRDATCRHETYGGGRYLLDTIKSADLGSNAELGTLVLDFNYAYHPSCAYDPRWVCPLAPPENQLALPVRTGERLT